MAPTPTPIPDDERAAEREARIRQLEDALRRPRRGVSAQVAAAVILLCGLMLWQQRLEFAYFFSAREPLVLGSAEGYRFEQLASNRYVQVHGTPTSRAIFGSDGSSKFVIVGLQATPILVRRGRLPGEAWDERGSPPPANAQPFSVGGRLLERSQAPRAYARAFEEFEQAHAIGPREGKLYLLLEGNRPDSHLGSAVFALFVAAFGGFNGVLLVRALRRRQPSGG